MDRQNKKGSCAGKSGRRKNDAGTDKEEEKKLAGHWLKRNCLLKDAQEGTVNGKKVRDKRRYKSIDNIMINGLYEDTKRKADEKVRVEDAGIERPALWQNTITD